MEDKVQQIKKNIEIIKFKIAEAAKKSFRNAEDIKIVAATKTVDAENILLLKDYDISCLGENRVQELLKKRNEMQDFFEWYFIGHLQTNKVKYILNRVNLIHSVDHLSLVEEIQKQAEKTGAIVDILIQINIAGEKAKYGIQPQNTFEFAKKISIHNNIRVRGIMTIAPHVENPEEVRFIFKEMKRKFLELKMEKIKNTDIIFLSMGMSNDYEIAIEEGANLIRLGTAIFGERQYNNLKHNVNPSECNFKAHSY